MIPPIDEEEKLDLCPFCGDDDVKVVTIWEISFVVCNFCGARGSMDHSKIRAIYKWNRAKRWQP